MKFKVGDRIVALPNTNSADLYQSGSTTGTVIEVEGFNIGVIMDKPVNKGYGGLIWANPNWIELAEVCKSPLWKALE